MVRIITSRRLRWAGYVAKMEGNTNAFKFLTDKPAGKRRLGRSRRRTDLQEIGINTRNFADSALGMDYGRALLNAALNLRVP